MILVILMIIDNLTITMTHGELVQTCVRGGFVCQPNLICRPMPSLCWNIGYKWGSEGKIDTEYKKPLDASNNNPVEESDIPDVIGLNLGEVKVVNEIMEDATRVSANAA